MEQSRTMKRDSLWVELCEGVAANRPGHEMMQILRRWFEAGFSSEVDPCDHVDSDAEMIGSVASLLTAYESLHRTRLRAAQMMRETVTAG